MISDLLPFIYIGLFLPLSHNISGPNSTRNNYDTMNLGILVYYTFPLDL